MLNNFMKKIIVFIFLLTPFQHVLGSASSYQESSSTEALISVLLHKDNEVFLLNLIVSTYQKEKQDPRLAKKMCTHGSDIVDKWKNYDANRPQGISRDQWRSIRQRGIISVFTDPKPLDKLDTHIKTLSSTVWRTQSPKEFLDVDFDMGEIVGEKYTDQDHPSPFQREKAGSSYEKVDLTHMRIIYDITPLIAAMQKRKLLGKDGMQMIPEDFEGLVSIASICPQG
jgi:hypothetical protein